MCASSDELKEIDGRVSQNRENIVELENSVKLLGEKKEEPPASYSGLQLQSGDNGLLLAKVMMKQTRFNTAIQLGYSPMMIFGGELHNYVQFVTMFWNSLIKLSTIRSHCTKYL